jgi:hypothetical protein
VSKTCSFVWIQFCLIVPLWAGNVTNGVQKSLRDGTTPAVTDIDFMKVPWNDVKPVTTLSDRIQYHLMERLESVSMRELHPFNTLFLLNEDNQLRYEKRVGLLGKDFVVKSIEQTVREIFSQIPFIYRIGRQDHFLARLWQGSFGNTEEEDFDAGQVSYSTNEVAQWQKVTGLDESTSTNQLSFWKRWTRDVHPRYGMRWNYAYTAFSLGQYEGRPLLLADLRYHYGDARTGDIMATDTEMLFSVPLGNRTLFITGIIFKIDPPDWNRRFSFRISQKIDGGRAFAGIKVSDVPGNNRTHYKFGFEMPW